jgi:hypothetical protein
VGSRQLYCVDYVQSHRANAGDTYLYLLFAEDVKSGSRDPPRSGDITPDQL